MDLKTTIELRSVQAAGKQDRFQPVHAGAHNRFTKAGYMHTGNKNRGGIATSEYFKTKGGNSRTVSVQADGSYVKTSRTVKGNKRSRGKFDAKGMKCGEEQKSVAAGGPGSGRYAGGEVKKTIDPSKFPVSINHKGTDYTRSGKFGHNMKTGEPSAEYIHHDENDHEDKPRVWQTESGKRNEE